MSICAFLFACNKQTTTDQGIEISVANPNSEPGFVGNATKVCWGSDDVLVATARNNLIQAFNVTTGDELWREATPVAIEAIDASDEHVYVLLETFHLDQPVQAIRRLTLTTGEDTTPKAVPQPFLPQEVFWCDEQDLLCVLQHDAIWAYSSDMTSVVSKIPYSGRLPFVSRADNVMLLAMDFGSCTAIDLDSGTVKHVHGQPLEGADRSVPIDSAFLSNAFLSPDGRLIRVIDNSWSTGTIHFHPTPESVAVQIDSGNGHAVAAVDWQTNRLVVSGTERNLSVFSTSGEFVAHVSEAASDRVLSLAFSPSDARVATLSRDGQIKVFDIP